MTILSLNDSSLDGFEALSVSEKIKMFFAELSVGIDKLNANLFNGSIHTVNGEGVLKILKRQNDFYTFSSNQIPTPVFFNPNKGSFREYVSFCISAVGLMDISGTEIDRLYTAFKAIVHNGTVPFSIRQWGHDKTVELVKQKMDFYFEDHKKTTQTINLVYSSITNAEETYKYYNDSVKNLRSRDVEVISKKLDLLIDLFKLIKKKIDGGDLSFTQEDTLTMELVISRLSDLITANGLIMGRLNELCRCLELQTEEFRRYLK